MTRKEEREKASIEYQMSVSPVVVGGAAFADEVEIFNINSSFIAGAQWADKTMIEKACEWLAPVFKDLAGYYSGSELLDDFKNYMKGM